MKALSPKATSIFSALLKNIGPNQHAVFTAEEYMPLSLERLYTWSGHSVTGTLYSLMHHFTQHGDLMRDPEMIFFVAAPVDLFSSGVTIYPCSYRLDSLGIDEESVLFEPGGHINIALRLQRNHTTFANQWLYNISQQGFLNTPPCNR